MNVEKFMLQVLDVSCFIPEDHVLPLPPTSIGIIHGKVFCESHPGRMTSVERQAGFIEPHERLTTGLSAEEAVSGVCRFQVNQLLKFFLS